jgi:hypothetical protein
MNECYYEVAQKNLAIAIGQHEVFVNNTHPHVSSHVEVTHIRNRRFWNGDWWVKVNEFDLGMCLILRSLVSRPILLLLA